ncbi:cellulose binding domain-containing protein [Streptomyces sp. NPDC052040]|uniref:cellulose binding domain-containing protein n=1 Tax=Streptomyces sp. NPDC052040 TaxID=3365682 RepID=UPI0037D07748
MPDLPTPQDAAEAALLSECWDAVLSYAELCTAGSGGARQLAAEAFGRGIGEVRDSEARAGATGHRTARLPRIPLLLAAVRTTAAAWEQQGRGHLLDPDLRLWLNSGKAARYTGPPLLRPPALRGLRDLQAPDAALLWLTEVEALPPPDAARRLGLDPAAAERERDQVRALFRDRCRRNHRETPMSPECRGYARLLDAASPAPGTGTGTTPEGLFLHLATCPECTEAAACLRARGEGTAAALASQVIGWGGLAYLERRRRAAKAGLSGGRADAGTDRGIAPGTAARRPRIGRTGTLAAALTVSALALTVSLLHSGDPNDRAHADADPAEAAAAVPTPSLPTPPRSATGTPKASAAPTRTGDSDTEPQSTSNSPVPDPSPAACRVTYTITDAWPKGFQAAVTITSARALDDWHLDWTYGNGQRITQLWDGHAAQHGPRVTVRAADYNRHIAAHGTAAFGFIATRHGPDTSPTAFTVNGTPCTLAP